MHSEAVDIHFTVNGEKSSIHSPLCHPLSQHTVYSVQMMLSLHNSHFHIHHSKVICDAVVPTKLMIAREVDMET